MPAGSGRSPKADNSRHRLGGLHEQAVRKGYAKPAPQIEEAQEIFLMLEGKIAIARAEALAVFGFVPGYLLFNVIAPALTKPTIIIVVAPLD